MKTTTPSFGKLLSRSQLFGNALKPTPYISDGDSARILFYINLSGAYGGNAGADQAQSDMDYIAEAVNVYPSDQARIEALIKALVSACVVIENEYPKGHACMDVARKGRAVLKGSL